MPQGSRSATTFAAIGNIHRQVGALTWYVSVRRLTRERLTELRTSTCRDAVLLMNPQGQLTATFKSVRRVQYEQNIDHWLVDHSVGAHSRQCRDSKLFHSPRQRYHRCATRQPGGLLAGAEKRALAHQVTCESRGREPGRQLILTLIVKEAAKRHEALSRRRHRQGVDGRHESGK